MTALTSGWTSELAEVRASYSQGVRQAQLAWPAYLDALSNTHPRARYDGWRSVQNRLANDIARCLDLGLPVDPAVIALWRRACERANDTAARWAAS